MIQDHQPIPIDKFLGLYGIDAFTDSVPSGYSIDERNVITYGDDVRTRDGFGLAHVTAGVVKKFEIYRKLGEANRILALIGDSIVDLTTGVTILTIGGMTNFTINYMNGRAFISPHTNVAGLPGAHVYIYNGTGVARKAAGLAPVAGFTATISNNAGVIEAGTHIFAWCFETDSGFTTGPCPAQTVVMPGNKAINFINIPVGPAGTAARRLIASRAIQDYNGNEEGYEMFFVPGGRINNNVATTLNDISFYDADLQFSADYVYDQLPEIPAVVFIRPYGNRMSYGGPDINKNLVYMSKPLEPESIHSSAGFISFDPFETQGVKDATEHRDNFYVCKRNKTYAVRDNSYEPSTWKPVTLDVSIGCDINGISKFWDTTGSKVEFFLIANTAGIYKFTGIYEEIPITRNIKNIWNSMNRMVVGSLQLIFDQDRALFYVLFPTGSNTIPDTILVANYENGIQVNQIKWHKWKFKDFLVTSISLDRTPGFAPVLKIAASTGGIHAQEVDRKNDNDTIIEQFIRFGFISGENNVINHTGAVGLRVKGNGFLNLRLEGEDRVDFQDLPDVKMSCAPGKEFIVLAHFQSEKTSLILSTSEVNEYFKIHCINMYTNPIFLSRPLG